MSRWQQSGLNIFISSLILSSLSSGIIEISLWVLVLTEASKNLDYHYCDHEIGFDYQSCWGPELSDDKITYFRTLDPINVRERRVTFDQSEPTWG